MTKKNAQRENTPAKLFDLKQHSNWVVGSLLLLLLITLAALVSSWLEFTVYDGRLAGQYTEQTFQALKTSSDARQGLIGLLQLLLMVISTGFLLNWTYRANGNLHALHVKGLQFSPKWAMGWFIIPVLNLWKPYPVLKELWQASHGSPDWRWQPVSILIPVWWLLWLGFLGLTFGSIVFLLGTQDIIDERNITLLTMITDSVSILLVSNIIWFVRHITALQKQQTLGAT
ncbi:DUF4328 domain-containing protein [Candidatus Neomarinimicrobiota bacterium]